MDTWIFHNSYKAKIKELRLKKQQDRESNRPKVLERYSECTWKWVLGQTKLTNDGQLIPKDFEVSEVVQE
jgi:hypothetical protein